MLFFKIFGVGVQNAGQAALYDTMIDMIIGLIGAVVGGFLILPYVKREILRYRKRKPSPDELRWERVKGRAPEYIAAVTAAK